MQLANWHKHCSPKRLFLFYHLLPLHRNQQTYSKYRYFSRNCYQHYQSVTICRRNYTNAVPGSSELTNAGKARQTDSLQEWLTTSHFPSSSQPQPLLPPSPHTRFLFKLNSSYPSTSISIVLPGKGKNSSPVHIPLSPSESLTAAVNLLTPLAATGTSLSSSLNNSTFIDNLKQPSSSPFLLRHVSQQQQLPPLTIEFSSPNIAKPLHMGHLRSTITGAFIRNIAEFAGHSCESVCFLGDWGRQFGVLHAGVEEDIKRNNDAKDSGSDVKFMDFVKGLNLYNLLQIYVNSSGKVEKNEEFKSQVLRYSAELEQSFLGDGAEQHRGSEMSNGCRLWEYTRNLTVEHLKNCYDTLGIQFDVFEGESEFRMGSEYVNKALKVLEEKGLSYVEEHCLRVKGLEDSCVLVKSDGSSVYLMRDIACAMRRLEQRQNLGSRDRDISKEDQRKFVYVVDNGQSSHFNNLFSVLRAMGLSKRCGEVTQEGSEYIDAEPLLGSGGWTHIHVPFNRVGGMSTRSGKFVLLSQVIEEGTKLMHEERRKSKNVRNMDDVGISERLALSGLVVNSLKMRRQKPYDFDWGEALRTNGNSGVSLQYSLVRVRSLIRRVREEIGVDGGWDCSGIGMKELGMLFGENDTKEGRNRRRKELSELVICLMNFEDAFWKSYGTLEPCVLVAYSFNLSDKISKVLGAIRILDAMVEDREFAEAALWSLEIGGKVLEICVGIIGMRVIEGDGF